MLRVLANTAITNYIGSTSSKSSHWTTACTRLPSPRISSALKKLRILRLGKGHFSIEEMIDLLSGPTRLESLLRIEFNNDLYSFDPNSLEVVKTELSEEGWFALSLREPDGLDE